MNTDISQGSVATRLGCGGGIYISLCYKFPTESNSERILKIGKYLVKLWARVRCLVFFDSRCRQIRIRLTKWIDVYWTEPSVADNRIMSVVKKGLQERSVVARWLMVMQMWMLWELSIFWKHLVNLKASSVIFINSSVILSEKSVIDFIKSVSCLINYSNEGTKWLIVLQILWNSYQRSNQHILPLISYVFKYVEYSWYTITVCHTKWLEISLCWCDLSVL